MVEVGMLLENASELHGLYAGLTQRCVGVLALVEGMDRRATKPRKCPGRLDGELPDLILLIESSLDLPDDVLQVLHTRDEGRDRYRAFGEARSRSRSHPRGRIGAHRDLAETWPARTAPLQDRKSTRLNSSHGYISYALFCL